MRSPAAQAFLAAGVLALIFLLRSPAGPEAAPHPLAVEALRQREYGGEIQIVRPLEDRGAFRSYLVSYPSDGSAVQALMNVPAGIKPPGGFPVLILARGFVPEGKYSTASSYREPADFFAANGYLVLKPDYRGYGASEGEAGERSPETFAHDILNLVSSAEKYPAADPERMAIWGHSFGGGAAIRALLVPSDLKAAVVVATGVLSPDMALAIGWTDRGPMGDELRELTDRFGSPERNPGFWASVSVLGHVSLIRTPVQLHHAVRDPISPIAVADALHRGLQRAGKTVEYFRYDTAEHLSPADPLVLRRSLEFFDRHLGQETTP